MYNKIILMGNLTRDVEIRYAKTNTPIGRVGIATSHKWKAKSGEKKEEVLFVDVTFFGRTAEIANQYLRKGSKVLLDGRLKLDQWTDEQGQKRSKHSVIVESIKMLDSKGDSDGYSQPQAQTQPTEPTQPAAPRVPPEVDINEDEMPF